MKTISQNVLDTLVVGIYEDVQMLFIMMIDYEEEIDMITKEEMITAHEKLKEVILFCQSHSQGMNVLLMEEIMVGINHRISEILREKHITENPNTIYGEKLLLPEGVTVRRRLETSSFQYIFDHETFGDIGRIVFQKENGYMLYFDAYLGEHVTENSPPALILKDIGDMLQKEILRVY
ncbi:hypothetical protein IIU_06749 [Bacillus cereus VD133]|uniref:Uncharacterized protein n=1 Tax=Bacillus cereus VD133 TaxID=1053233 RepID=A0A9W5UZ13_BACCE|nr:hypothetical protein [Bacillus cereus]EOO24379.1 hypothetical protein IIU_06749 [Bacillus cereus VD133]